MSKQGIIRVCTYSPHFETSIQATIEIATERGQHDVMRALDAWLGEVKQQLVAQYPSVFQDPVQQELDSWMDHAEKKRAPSPGEPYVPAKTVLNTAIEGLFFRDNMVQLDDDKPEAMLNALTLVGFTNEADQPGPCIQDAIWQDLRAPYREVPGPTPPTMQLPDLHFEIQSEPASLTFCEDGLLGLAWAGGRFRFEAARELRDYLACLRGQEVAQEVMSLLAKHRAQAVRDPA